MFDRIARVYDRMNSVMTAGMHHRWRSRAADLAQAAPGSRALDVATGTGDLAIELASRGADVTGMDFSAEMLAIARRKAPAIPFEEGKEITASSGCLGCHKIGENGNTLGPALTEIGDTLGRDAIARTLVNPTPPMPSYQQLLDENPEQFQKLVEYVASLKGEE